MEYKEKKSEGQSAFRVMLGLIGMVKPLLGIMLAAVIMGCIGNLTASFLTILGGVGIGKVFGYFEGIRTESLFILMILFAVLRGILRYAEQASNHYIAFKLLARIRHKVFASLRSLAPAKLDGSEKGNLISIITSDIELLEVFYAHTISPIAIAVLTSLFLCLFIGSFHPLPGVLAGIFYLVVGLVIPVVNSRAGQAYGREYRSLYGKLNTVALDNLYGLDEILQYQQQDTRMKRMEEYTAKLEQVNRTLKAQEARQKIVTDSVILTAGIVMLVVSGSLAAAGSINGGEALVCTIALMSSFGPVAALSALSNNLNQTLASGSRVLELLREQPAVTDICGKNQTCDGDIEVREVTFSYGGEGEEADILKHFSQVFETGKIHGILGKSGCGKSTLLKLLMRFYEADKGTVCYGGRNVNDVDTSALRKHIAYVTQDTFLFGDTIENNIKVAREGASREDVMEAARKASIHDFISSLPQGYDTQLSELGESVSGGERQRIGIARAFLHQAQVLLLDEPTSNIDSLNEGMILRSLDNEKEDRTVILVSHRSSTMGIADKVTAM